jgi:hypothetical protein
MNTQPNQTGDLRIIARQSTRPTQQPSPARTIAEYLKARDLEQKGIVLPIPDYTMSTGW